MIDREEAFCLDTTISHLGGSHGPIRQVERGDQSGASKVLPTKNPNSGGDCGSHATPLQVEVRGSIPSTIPRKCCGSSDTTTVIRVAGDMSCSSALVAKHMFLGARCHLILARGESFTTTYKIFRETKFISKSPTASQILFAAFGGSIAENGITESIATKIYASMSDRHSLINPAVITF